MKCPAYMLEAFCFVGLEKKRELPYRSLFFTKEVKRTMLPRVEGTVKWFSRSKGYGFIQRPEGPDVFVHYTAITGEGFRNLEEGDRVEFSIEEGPKGPHAVEVVKL